MTPSNLSGPRNGRTAGTALAIALATVLSFATVGSAWARDRFEGREQRGGSFRESRGAERAERMQRFRGERMAPQRDFDRRGPERRDAAPQSPPPNFGPPPQAPQVPQGRPGRLTPDERRALRQQINDAGRDVYRPQRP